MIFTANYVFPVSSAPIRDGYVECREDGTVVSVGKFDDAARSRFAKEEVRSFKGFLTPGFCNAHCHSELSYMKGMFRQGTGMDGFIQQINALRTTVGPEERATALREAFEGLISQGVTCMGDISNCDESFSIKKELSDKIFTRTFLEVFGTEPEDAEGIMKDVLALQDKARQIGIEAAPTPHSCYTMSPLLNRLSAAEGLKSGYISYHSQESSEEEDMLRYGTGPLAEDYRGRGTTQLPVTGTGALEYFLDNLEKAVEMPVEGNVLLVHNVATDQRSIDLAKQRLRHSFWAVCPLSNIFIHRALPPFDLLRSNGLSICVGTDSLSSNLVLSIVAELFCIQDHFPHIPLAEMLEWACLNGAKAIGCDATHGTLETGKKPGVVLIENVDVENVRLTKNSKSSRII